MDDIYKVCGIAVITVALTAVLKNRSSVLSPYVSQLASMLIFISAVASLKPVIELINSLAKGNSADISSIYLITLAGAIATVSGIVSEICRENGELMLKRAVEFSANAEITVLSLPLIKAILSKAYEIISL